MTVQSHKIYHSQSHARDKYEKKSAFVLIELTQHSIISAGLRMDENRIEANKRHKIKESTNLLSKLNGTNQFYFYLYIYNIHVELH